MGVGDDAPRKKPKMLAEEWPGGLSKARVVMLGLWRSAHDIPVAYKMVASLLVMVLAAVSRQWLDLTIIAAATGLLLSTEMFNSAIEMICDYLTTGKDERIGAIKDVAAAAAGTATLFWIIVVGVEAARLIARST